MPPQSKDVGAVHVLVTTPRPQEVRAETSSVEVAFANPIAHSSVTAKGDEAGTAIGQSMVKAAGGAAIIGFVTSFGVVIVVTLAIALLPHASVVFHV